MSVASHTTESDPCGGPGRSITRCGIAQATSWHEKSRILERFYVGNHLKSDAKQPCYCVHIPIYIYSRTGSKRYLCTSQLLDVMRLRRENPEFKDCWDSPKIKPCRARSAQNLAMASFWAAGGCRKNRVCNHKNMICRGKLLQNEKKSRAALQARKKTVLRHLQILEMGAKRQKKWNPEIKIPPKFQTNKRRKSRFDRNFLKGGGGWKAIGWYRS